MEIEWKSGRLTCGTSGTTLTSGTSETSGPKSNHLRIRPFSAL